MSFEKPSATSSDEKQTENNANVPILCSERWRLAYLAFFGFVFVYALRVNISVAIVCMVKADNSTNNSTTSDACGGGQLASDSEDMGEFDWNKGIQSGILSSFFYGYIVMQVPGGWLAGRFGGKRVLGIAMTIVATATVLLPVLARQDYRFVYALRVVMGLASGVSFPSMHAMWGKWAPPSETSRLPSFGYTGLIIGNIVTFIFSGYLCADGFDHGWGSVFYVSGGACFLWLAAWWLLVSDTPDTCSRISKAERDYIVHSIGNKPNTNFKVPWRAIATSQAMWACLTAHFCNNWMHYTLVTSLPTFMKEVLHYDIKQNGVLSAVPYMSMAVTAIFGGHVADFLRARCLSTRTTRRLFQIISFLGAGGCLVGVGFVDCEHRTLAVVLLAVAVAFEGLCYSGYVVNHIDFAPRFAGVLFGITNCVSTVPGIIAPEVAGALTPNKTQAEWRNVFYVCGGFTLLGAIVFGGFAKTDTEPWAKDPDEEKLDEIRKTELEVGGSWAKGPDEEKLDEIRKTRLEAGTKGRVNEKTAYDNEGMDRTDDVAVYRGALDTRL